jgi:hypothetical protein
VAPKSDQPLRCEPRWWRFDEGDHRRLVAVAVAVDSSDVRGPDALVLDEARNSTH